MQRFQVKTLNSIVPIRGVAHRVSLRGMSRIKKREIDGMCGGINDCSCLNMGYVLLVYRRRAPLLAAP